MSRAMNKGMAGAIGHVVSHFGTGTGLMSMPGAFSSSGSVAAPLSVAQTAVSAVGMFKNLNPLGGIGLSTVGTV